MDNNEEFNENSKLDEYGLQLDKIVKSKKHLAVTRLLASELMDNPYFTVGKFFENISDADLDTLSIMSENITDEEQEDLDGGEDILLLTMMLASAEGSNPTTLEDLQNKVSMFTIFIAGTSLYRKGLVKAYFKNMSFNDDSNKLIVFEKL